MKGDPEVNCRYQAIVASVRFLFAFSGSMSDMEISRQLTKSQFPNTDHSSRAAAKKTALLVSGAPPAVSVPVFGPPVPQEPPLSPESGLRLHGGETRNKTTGPLAHLPRCGADYGCRRLAQILVSVSR